MGEISDSSYKTPVWTYDAYQYLKFFVQQTHFLLIYLIWVRLTTTQLMGNNLALNCSGL